jgi:uncharacterized OsmC-like protein
MQILQGIFRRGTNVWKEEERQNDIKGAEPHDLLVASILECSA